MPDKMNHEEFKNAGQASQQTVEQIYDQRYGAYQGIKKGTPSEKMNDQIAPPFSKLTGGK